eukprot:1259066-Alexandrium_andersonii.AAC.1
MCYPPVLALGRSDRRVVPLRVLGGRSGATRRPFTPWGRCSAPVAARRLGLRSLVFFATDGEFVETGVGEPATSFMLRGDKEARARAREESVGPLRQPPPGRPLG